MIKIEVNFGGLHIEQESGDEAVITSAAGDTIVSPDLVHQLDQQYHRVRAMLVARAAEK